MFRQILILALAAGASAFSTHRFAAQPRRASMASALLYSTTTGNTETCAGYISEAVGCDMYDISEVEGSFLEETDCLIVGAPTWHTGADDQRSGTAWDDFLYDTLPSLNLK